jgi:hypothetical protein
VPRAGLRLVPRPAVAPLGPGADPAGADLPLPFLALDGGCPNRAPSSFALVGDTTLLRRGEGQGWCDDEVEAVRVEAKQGPARTRGTLTGRWIVRGDGGNRHAEWHTRINATASSFPSATSRRWPR